MPYKKAPISRLEIGATPPYFISFPNAGGTAVSDRTLSAQEPWRPCFRFKNSEIMKRPIFFQLNKSHAEANLPNFYREKMANILFILEILCKYF